MFKPKHLNATFIMFVEVVTRCT